MLQKTHWIIDHNWYLMLINYCKVYVCYGLVNANASWLIMHLLHIKILLLYEIKQMQNIYWCLSVYYVYYVLICMWVCKSFCFISQHETVIYHTRRVLHIIIYNTHNTYFYICIYIYIHRIGTLHITMYNNNTMWCYYKAVDFLPNTHKRHLIAHPWGWDMGCLCEFKIWFIFCNTMIYQNML